MILFSAWDIGNYRWAEAFIWIAAYAALIFGLFLFGSYLNSRKKNILLWAIAFFGIYVFNYEMLEFMVTATNRMTGDTVISAGPGLYTPLIGAFGYAAMSDMVVGMLPALIPGFIAAGLCYNKDKKFGFIYTIYVTVLSVIYLFFLCAPNIDLIPYDTLIAAILILLVQLPSGALIIALPIMKEGKIVPRTMVAAGGGLMLGTNIFLWLIRLAEAIGKPMLGGEGQSIDIFLMIYPFIFIISILCLIYGLIGDKDYGFELPHVEFED